MAISLKFHRPDSSPLSSDTYLPFSPLPLRLLRNSSSAGPTWLGGGSSESESEWEVSAFG